MDNANEYKPLYEQSKVRLAEIEQLEKASALTATKQTLLLAAGYPAEKLADVTGFITGDDEDELKASIERFKVVAPPTPPKPLPVDPSFFGSGRRQPKQSNGYEEARERARKILKR